MTFREWINEDFDEIAQEVNTFLMKVRTYVLKHKKFPNYHIFFPGKPESKILGKLQSLADEVGEIFELKVKSEDSELFHNIFEKIEKIAGKSHAKNWLEIIEHHASGLADEIKRKNYAITD